jgi:hypothetical protein
MSMRLFITIALLIGSSWVHGESAAPDDPMKRFFLAKQIYYDALRRSAEEQLDDVYQATDAGIRDRISRSNVKVEIRTGVDRECHSAFKVGYLIPRKNVIVVCEEDVSTAADFLVGWWLLMSAEMRENPDVFENESARNRPLPEKINRRYKMQVTQLAQYLVSSNRGVKDQLFATHGYGRSPCRGWEAAYRIAHASSSLEACSRNSLSPQETEQSARWGTEVVKYAQNVIQRFMGLRQPEQQTPAMTPAFAEAAMNELRSAYIDRFLYYVVAHEFGHIVNSENETKMTLREGELAADRFAASAINTFMARAVALPYLSFSLDILWATAKDAAVANRADSLHTVVFCEREQLLRSNGTTPFDAQLINIMGGSCPRP